MPLVLKYPIVIIGKYIYLLDALIWKNPIIGLAIWIVYIVYLLKDKHASKVFGLGFALFACLAGIMINEDIDVVLMKSIEEMNEMNTYGCLYAILGLICWIGYILPFAKKKNVHEYTEEEFNALKRTCMHCGAHYKKGQKHCPKCGYELKNSPKK